MQAKNDLMTVVADGQIKKLLGTETKALSVEMGAEVLKDAVVSASAKLTGALEKMESMLSMLEKIHQAQKMV